MYTDLDRIDLVATNKKDGSKMFLQTDHRTPEEYEQDRDLSIVFVAVRVLTARNAGIESGKSYAVRYGAQHMPPEMFRGIIASAGGMLHVGGHDVPYSGDAMDIQALLDNALAARARQTAATLKEDFTIEALERYENAMAGRRIDREEDPEGYWREVIDAGAFAGEVIRKSHGGSWSLQHPDIGPLPLVFDIRGLAGNLMGKAVKFIENGAEDSLAWMVRSLPDILAEHDAAPERPSALPKKGLMGRLFKK